MSNSFLVGKFWHPEAMMGALKELHHEGVHVHDVYAPFPIHGIEPYLNIKRTRLSVASFIYGCFGFLLALLMMGGIYGLIWPMNIGGKPALAWVDFVPITFEMTVFCAAHGMVITFLIIARLYPGKKAELLDLRQTDDVFVIAVNKNKTKDTTGIRQVLSKHGAFEVTEKEADI